MGRSADSQRDFDPSGEPIIGHWSFTWLLLKVVAVAVLALSIGAALLVPAIQSAREAANRATCTKHLMQLGLAFHNYLSAHGTFPPAYTVDADGRPMHSWRVLLLPYFEGGVEETGYNFSEPWDSVVNRAAIERMPGVYRCASNEDAELGTTNYVAVLGNNTFWPYTAGRKPAEITDGLSNTILLVEVVGANIPWTKPEEFELNTIPLELNPSSGLGISSAHPEGTNVLMVDGSVKFLRNDITPKALRALVTVDGGEKITYLDGNGVETQ